VSTNLTAAVPSVSSNVFSGAAQLLKWIFSFPSMLLAIFLGCLLYRLRDFKVDPDLWWHIRIGQDILRTHQWPTNDPYSFTVHGTPWMAYEWLGDVAIGFVARFGLQALEAMLMVMAALITGALYAYASLSAKNAKAGFVATMLVTVFAVANFNLRPQMFGALFLSLTVILLEMFRQGKPKALFAFPLLFLLWINAHGSWIVGMAVVVATLLAGLFEFEMGGVESTKWTARQRIQLELALLGSLAVIPITPYGSRLATYPFLVASSIPLGVKFVMEWSSMPFNLYWGRFFLALVAGTTLVQTIYPCRFRLQQWVLAIGGVVMACMHVRFVLMFAPFFAPVLAAMLSRWFDQYRPEKDKFVLNGALITAAVAITVWYFPSRAELERDVQKQFPTGAVNFLRHYQVQEPIYNTYNYGGYLVGALPEHRVFIDGREDLYEFEGVMNDYLQVAWLKPSIFSVLRFYGIKTCLLERGEPLSYVLAEHSEWRRVYQDDQSIVFERTTPVNEAEEANADPHSTERKRL